MAPVTIYVGDLRLRCLGLQTRGASHRRTALTAQSASRPPHAPSARRRSVWSQERLQVDVRRRAPAPRSPRRAAPASARPAASASRPGSTVTRLDEIRGHRVRRLVLEAVRDRRHPRRRHLDRDEARMRGVHQREPEVVLAQHASRRRPAPGAAAVAARRPPPSSMRRSPSTVPIPFSSQPRAEHALPPPPGSGRAHRARTCCAPRAARAARRKAAGACCARRARRRWAARWP